MDTMQKSLNFLEQITPLTYDIHDRKLRKRKVILTFVCLLFGSGKKPRLFFYQHPINFRDFNYLKQNEKLERCKLLNLTVMSQLLIIA